MCRGFPVLVMNALYKTFLQDLLSSLSYQLDELSLSQETYNECTDASTVSTNKLPFQDHLLNNTIISTQ